MKPDATPEEVDAVVNDTQAGSQIFAQAVSFSYIPFDYLSQRLNPFYSSLHLLAMENQELLTAKCKIDMVTSRKLSVH